MERRLGIAIVCVIAIAVFGVGALAMRAVAGSADRPVTAAAVDREPGNDSVLPARRVVVHGSSLPLLLALAAATTAGIAVPGGSILVRRPAVGPWFPSLLRVPCGTRAPPALRTV